MSLHKSNSQNQSRQLMRPMWRVETMVLPVQIGSRKTCLQKEETYRALSTRNSQFQKGLIVTHLTELNVNKRCQSSNTLKWHFIKPRQSLQQQSFLKNQILVSTKILRGYII